MIVRSRRCSDRLAVGHLREGAAKLRVALLPDRGGVSRCFSERMTDDMRCRDVDGASLDVQHSSRNSVEFGDEVGVADFRRGDQRDVEGAVGADRAWLVFARECTGELGNE